MSNTTLKPAVGAQVERGVGRLVNDPKLWRYPVADPTRLRHRGDKINAKGGVSALCFPAPRAIDMKRATWVMNDDAVTCPKCRALILARHEPPNVGAERAPTAGTD